MTSAQRLDRLERIVKLMICAGLRGREHMRELDQKFETLADAQITNEDLFRRNNEEFGRRFTALSSEQAQTGRELKELIAIVRQGRTGETFN